jgi:hypothetical protein
MEKKNKIILINTTTSIVYAIRVYLGILCNIFKCRDLQTEFTSFRELAKAYA